MGIITEKQRFANIYWIASLITHANKFAWGPMALAMTIAGSDAAIQNKNGAMPRFLFDDQVFAGHININRTAVTNVTGQYQIGDFIFNLRHNQTL